MHKPFALTCLIALAAVTLTMPLLGQIERTTYRIDVPSDWYLTPTEYPCLSETIHVTGTYQEHFNFVVNPASIAHVTIHQTTDNLTAVGLTTGETYRNSGPLTITALGSAETAEIETLVFTLHNVNHFVGPGSKPNIYLRTLVHVTFDPNGIPKVEVSRDDVLCR